MKLQKIIIVGEGPVAYYLAKRFRHRTRELLVVTTTAQSAREFAERLDVPAIAADATLPGVMEELEMFSADIVVALRDEDHDNFVICRAAQVMHGVPRAVALVNDPEHRDVFARLGLTSVVSAAEIVGGVIEQKSVFEGMLSRIDLADARVEVMQLRIGADARGVGHTLSALGLPEGSLVATIVRGEDVLIPRGTMTIEAGDEILLVCRKEAETAALEVLLGGLS